MIGYSGVLVKSMDAPSVELEAEIRGCTQTLYFVLLGTTLLKGPGVDQGADMTC